MPVVFDFILPSEAFARLVELVNQALYEDSKQPVADEDLVQLAKFLRPIAAQRGLHIL